MDLSYLGKDNPSDIQWQNNTPYVSLAPNLNKNRKNRQNADQNRLILYLSKSITKRGPQSPTKATNIAPPKICLKVLGLYDDGGLLCVGVGSGESAGGLGILGGRV